MREVKAHIRPFEVEVFVVSVVAERNRGAIKVVAGLVLEARTASYGQVLETPVHAMVVGAAVLPFEKGTPPRDPRPTPKGPQTDPRLTPD